MKLFEIYQQYLTETAQISKIEQGIKRGDIVIIDYDPQDDDPEEQNKGAGRRVIIPFVLGISKNDNQVIRAWQLSGKSRTPQGRLGDPLTRISGWRMFRVDRIKSWNKSSRTLTNNFLQVLSPSEMQLIKQYNPNDKDMKRVLVASNFNQNTQ